jgi:hypothetical protein
MPLKHAIAYRCGRRTEEEELQNILEVSLTSDFYFRDKYRKKNVSRWKSRQYV